VCFCLGISSISDWFIMLFFSLCINLHPSFCYSLDQIYLFFVCFSLGISSISDWFIMLFFSLCGESNLLSTCFCYCICLTASIGSPIIRHSSGFYRLSSKPPLRMELAGISITQH
jgi:hypothetical protein